MPPEETEMYCAGAESDPESSRAANVMWIRSVALSGIFLLLTMYTMYFAAALIVPIVLAFLLNLLLAPVVRVMVRLRIPQSLSALTVMLGVAGIMVAAVYTLAAPTAQWIERAPSELRRLEYKLAWVKEPIEEVQEVKQQVGEMTGGESESGDGDGGGASQQPSFSLVDTLLNRTPDVVFGIGVMLVLLFFLLASGDAFLNKMVQVAPTLRDKKRVVETAREIQHHVSVYLGTITVVNLGVGIVIAVAMQLLGMPNPLLWGAMVGVLNFIPYLGVAISIVIVAFASLLTFDTLIHVLLPPAAILAVNVVEGQFITPIVAGRRLALSPVAVFLSLVVLGWIWGIVGVLIAVPILASIKLVCEQVEMLAPVATFLGR